MQPSSPVTQPDTDQPPVIEKVLPSMLAAGPLIAEEKDSDTDMALQLAEELSPVHPLEEEGELLDQVAHISTQEPDQLLSEKYWETVW